MRWTRGKLVILAALAAGLFAAPRNFLEEARALDGEVAELARVAEHGSRQQRLKAMDALRQLGTDDAETALSSLADSRNEQTAAFAMSALARTGTSDAEQKLKAVLEDTKRSDLARSFALTNWCTLRAKEGDSWDDVKGYVDAKAGANAALTDAAAAVKKAQFEKEAK
jgi:hypothetical protein